MAQQLENWQAKLDKVLHEKNAFTDALEKVEGKTGVKRSYLVMGLGVFLALYLMIGYGAQFLCNFVGFLYPAYASIKAIESTVKEDDTKWLTYWVVYSCFSLVESFTDILLFWIPFYCFLKCIFLVYCMAPTSWNGSLTIYQKVIRPLFLKHQQDVDKVLNKAADMAQDVINEAEEAGADSIRQRVVDSAKLE